MQGLDYDWKDNKYRIYLDAATAKEKKDFIIGLMKSAANSRLQDLS